MVEAEYYFDEAKAFCAQGKTAEEIKAYDKYIELNPHYAIAYYNRRIAIEKEKRKSGIENIPPAEHKRNFEFIQGINLEGEFRSASSDEKRDALSSRTNFVISVIGCVSKDEFSSDSSDEEQDDTFPEGMFKFREDKRCMPFTTSRPKFKGPTFKGPKLEKDYKNDFEDIPN